MLTSTMELAQVVELGAEERAGLEASAKLFRIGITPYYASLMDPQHASCPIRMQAIPRAAEANIRDEELRDPLGDGWSAVTSHRQRASSRRGSSTSRARSGSATC